MTHRHRTTLAREATLAPRTDRSSGLALSFEISSARASRMWFGAVLPTLVIAALAIAVLASPARAEFSRTFSFEGQSLTVANLVGEIRIVEGRSQSFEVEARVRGADATEALIDFEQRSGADSRLLVKFPVDRHTRYIYPGYRGRTTLSRSYNDQSSLLSRVLEALTSSNVEVSGSGTGLELWTDLVISVPAGKRLELENGVGDVSVNGVHGELMVKSRTGKLAGTGLEGDSTFDLGSGAVTLSAIRGALVVDTGSGSVSVRDFDGPRLSVDTGSGGVSLSQIRTRRLDVDTGSGSVDAVDVAARDAVIDTGSGTVRLSLTEMGSGEFVIDTGSGGITLLLPEYASARVAAETGSGGIDVGLADVRVLHRERNEMHFEVGKGDASVRLDTGSGSIRIAGLKP